MKVLKKCISLSMVSVFIMCMVLIYCSETDLTVNATNNYLEYGQQYYIKNVNSGKYLTVNGSLTGI